MLVILAIMAVRELRWCIQKYRVDTNQAFGLSAPIATSLVGGGPAVMLWGLVAPSRLVEIALTFASDGSSFPR